MIRKCTRGLHKEKNLVTESMGKDGKDNSEIAGDGDSIKLKKIK